MAKHLGYPERAVVPAAPSFEQWWASQQPAARRAAAVRATSAAVVGLAMLFGFLG